MVTIHGVLVLTFIWICSVDNVDDSIRRITFVLFRFCHLCEFCPLTMFMTVSKRLLLFCPGFAIRVDLLSHWLTFASAANVAPRDSRVDFDMKRL